MDKYNELDSETPTMDICTETLTLEVGIVVPTTPAELGLWSHKQPGQHAPPCTMPFKSILAHRSFYCSFKSAHAVSN